MTLYILAGSAHRAQRWAETFELMPGEWIHATEWSLKGRIGGKFVACPSWFNNNGNGPWSNAREVINQLAVIGAVRDFERQAVIDLEEQHRRAVRRSVERHLARATAANAERVNSEGGTS